MSSTPYDVPALVKKINTTSNDLDKDTGEARRQCLDAARSLIFALETPVESILRNVWAEQGYHAALRAAIDLNLFEKLDERDGDAKSSSELAKTTGADPQLMARLLKHLAAMGSIYETGPNEYVPTPLSKALKEPIYRDAYPTMFGICGPAFFALPEHLSKTQYKNPDNPIDGAFQLGHGTKNHFFEWVSQRPERLSQFQHHMAGYRTGRPSWMDPNFYPVEQNLVEGAKTEDDAVFLVDVGGGKGHDLQELHRKHPTLPGKLVLQELKDVIEEASASGLGEKIVPMEHDFFTKQPVLGARAYYMHSCLHDWPDSKAHEILTSLKPGLTKGYSKLLINENVIPDRGAHWVSTALDMVMMANFSACERTEQDWRALLESAGFKIVKIWTFEPGTESLIEAEVLGD
ncbi:hypothetical protein IMSHALPRED_008255 [Imshaugia aleurites]|uniref:O-methyltransferase n=1 Tax=Imshaugia aleurites TaxID=172621 RepID=A0A8H3IJU2_9LECA|nr:hypothetical protein IMSHALPRED_008255 [Imshaugia aleurites]